MKKVISTRGLVLRTVGYSDTSQIVTLFTKAQGVVSVLAKGSLRLSRGSSSFPSPFDLAGWYDVTYRTRNTELNLATESRLLEGFDGLRTSLPSMVETYLALEVMGRMFSPADPHSDFLRAALYYLRLLEQVRDPAGLVALRIHFFQAMLRELGLAPQWDGCLDCGGPFARGHRWAPPYGLICPDCGQGRGVPIAHEVIRYLRAEQARGWLDFESLRPPRALVEECWDLISRVLFHYLERKPRSLRYLNLGLEHLQLRGTGSPETLCSTRVEKP